jgi:hypothetical protein
VIFHAWNLRSYLKIQRVCLLKDEKKAELSAYPISSKTFIGTDD